MYKRFFIVVEDGLPIMGFESGDEAQTFARTLTLTDSKIYENDREHTPVVVKVRPTICKVLDD